MDVRTARSEEWPQAAQWVFARAVACEAFLDHLQSGRIDPSGLLVAVEANTVIGAVLVEFFPGRVAEVVPPSADTSDAENALAIAAVARLEKAEIQLAQAFLEPTEKARAAPLEFSGFRRIAQIQRRTRLLPSREPHSPTGSNLEFICFSEATRAEFERMLLATYEGSLDVPEAHAERNAADVLAGYMHGQPEHPVWRLVRNGSVESVGVLLLSVAGELTYFGVVPGARRLGYGRSILREARRLAESLGFGKLELLVDSRNAPAIDLYEREGFELVGAQDVYLWRKSL